MGDLPVQVGRRWWFRPQFSLRSVLVLMTLCSVGTWYWYQRPFVVETKHGGTGSSPYGPRGPLVAREVEYVRRVWGGKTMRHGERRMYDNADKLEAIENYRNGQAHGAFIRYWSTGELEHRDYYVRGLLHGPREQWASNGTKILDGNYEYGKRHGRFHYWSDDGELSIEAFFDHDVPVGKWTWHPIDVEARKGGKNAKNPHTISGQWLDGAPDGLWEWRDAQGDVYLAARFRRGSVVALQGPSNLGPRVIEGLIERCTERPELLMRPFDYSAINLRGSPLKDFIIGQQDLMRLPMVMNPRGLVAVGIAPDARVTYEGPDKPLLMAMCEILSTRDLGCDWRYGVLFIDRTDSIADWRDQTSMLALTPPAGTHLAQELDRETSMDFVAMPLKRVLMYAQELHKVRIQLLVPSKPAAGQSATDDMPISVTLRGVTLRSALGVILSLAGCKASAEGETIVVEPQ